MQTVNPVTLTKFSRLLTYLNRAKKEFEIVADEIEDCDLRSAISNLSHESGQYSSMLLSQLQRFGVNYQYPAEQPVFEGANSIYNNPGSDTNGVEINYICLNSESFITRAYRDILKEGSLFDTLKKILKLQLVALKYAFMKIRLLNAARFSN